MCWWLTLGTTDAAAASARLAAVGLDVKQVEDPLLAAPMPSGLVLLDVTHGGCSCDLWAGRKSDEAAREQLEERYRKKGWTPAKIARALQSAKRPSARHAGGAHAAALAAVLGELCTRQPVFLFSAPSPERARRTGRT